MANYTYDVWGVCTVSASADYTEVANANPYRYRGYYYDVETGLYYLQSRYYDPEVGRFINGDKANNIGFFDKLLSNNYFAFCANDPINETDIDGAIFFTILKTIGRMFFSAITGVGIQYLVDKFLSLVYGKNMTSDKNTYITVAVQGAIDGFWQTGFLGGIIKSISSNLLKQFVEMIWNGKKFETDQLYEAVTDSIIIGMLSKLSIKSPRYIRDIKKKARSKGIKGTKKLLRYLKKEKIKIEVINFGLDGLKTFFYDTIKRTIVDIIKILGEISSQIIRSIESDIKKARA